MTKISNLTCVNPNKPKIMCLHSRMKILDIDTNCSVELSNRIFSLLKLQNEAKHLAISHLKIFHFIDCQGLELRLISTPVINFKMCPKLLKKRKGKSLSK